MEEGSAFIVIAPGTWPPVLPLLAESRLDEKTTTTFTAAPDGAIGFSCRVDGRIIAEASTPRVQFAGRGNAVIIATWKDGTASLYVNDTDMTATRESRDRCVTVPLSQPAPDPIPSYLHPDAALACAGKVKE